MNILEARRRTLGGRTIKRTAAGNPAVAQGSLARRGPGITMQGWTEQEETTGSQLYDQSLAEDNKYQNFDINSNDFSIVPNNEFWITGKIPVKPNTTYTMNVNAFGVYYSDADTPITTTFKEENPFTTPENANYVCLNVKKSNYQFGSDIMLNEGSTALPWEPYTGGAPSPSPEYPQEITSAGNWNETAQKWEYEIEISNAEQNPTEIQTVTLTADRPLTKWDKLEKRNGQWGWMYKSAEVVFDGDTSEGWILYNTLTDVNVFYMDISDTLDKANGMEIFCNKMENVRNGYSVDRPYIICGHNNYGNIYVNVKPTDASKVSGFKTWLSENPLTVLFETSTETFVPLTSAEQEAMNALYTYRPTTVLSNQQGCQMALTYKTRKSMEVTA